MTTKKNLVKQMFMSIVTAGVFTFSFSSCSDEIDSPNAGMNNQQAPEGAKTELLEAYGLSFENFINEDDVIIVDADTTQLSISKAYADKMGITSFVNHPMGIWHKVSNLPYIRKATSEKLVGDRYIVNVVPATIAEITGDKKMNLQTNIYVNQDAGSVKTRAAGSDIPEYAAKYIDANDVIHPAAILMTDPYGYDKDIHFSDEQPSAAQTRAARSGEFEYMTADEIANGQTRWGTHRRLLSVNNKFKKEFKFAAKGKKDSLTVNIGSELDFELNYFLTLEGGVKWEGFLPDPYVKKFETGVDGHFDLDARIDFKFEKKFDLEDRLKFEFAKFPGYTFAFFIGPIPVSISISPNMFIKADGSVGGCITTGFGYKYGKEFKAGVRYENGKWEGIKEFKETASKFDITPARAEFELKGGVGLYLGADVLIYGCAGPEIAIGPRFGVEFKGVGKLFENPQKPEDLYELEAKVGLTINAVIGAKLKVLGYELANSETTIALVPEWVLWKYPSDGTEHKSPEEQKKIDNVNLWPEVKKVVLPSDKDVESYEDILNYYMEMNQKTRKEAEDYIANEMLGGFNTGKINVSNMKNGKDQDILEKLQTVYDNIQCRISYDYKNYCIEKNMSEMFQMFKGNEAYIIYSGYLPCWEKSINLRELDEEFVSHYRHHPEQTAEDIQKLLVMAFRYSEIYFEKNMAEYNDCYYFILQFFKDKHIKASQRIQHRAACEAILQGTKVAKKNPRNSSHYSYFRDTAWRFVEQLELIQHRGVEIK